MVRPAKDYFGRRRDTYYQATHRPLNCLLFLLPLIVVYEVGSLLVGALPLDSPPQRVVAFYWIVQFIGLFASVPTFLPGFLLVAVLLAWQYFSGQKWKARWPVVAGMGAESVVFCLPLLTLNRVFQRIDVSALAGGGGVRELGESMIIALTAGIYEELIFRLLLFWILYILLVEIMELPKVASMVAIVIGTAVLFSAYHYLGRESFAWGTFMFRTSAGVLLGIVYVLRGFGVTVGTHAVYDIAVTFLSRGS